MDRAGPAAAGGAGAAERLARAALTRVLEPGDERGGRWLRECGAVGLWRRITDPAGEAERLRG
ncbi:DNA-protecting protein DprA, partial [Streptomyces sp. SID2563]|nr:DNA-protecting protein DprA [Streptomyces sp. SID2563]